MCLDGGKDKQRNAKHAIGKRGVAVRAAVGALLVTGPI